MDDSETKYMRILRTRTNIFLGVEPSKLDESTLGKKSQDILSLINELKALLVTPSYSEHYNLLNGLLQKLKAKQEQFDYAELDLLEMITSEHDALIDFEDANQNDNANFVSDWLAERGDVHKSAQKELEDIALLKRLEELEENSFDRNRALKQ